MSENGKISAEWVGPGGAEATIDGVKVALNPGTICEIGFHEAHASDNWQPVAEPSAHHRKGRDKAEGAE